MLSKLKMLFTKRGTFLGRFRTLDTNPVYAQIINLFSKSGSPTTKGQVSDAYTIASVASGQTALASGSQTGATPITALMTEFTTVAASGASCILPPSYAGAGPFYIDNASSGGGANPMNIYPAVGEQINGTTANTAFSLASNKRVAIWCVVAGNWKTNLTA